MSIFNSAKMMGQLHTSLFVPHGPDLVPWSHLDAKKLEYVISSWAAMFLAKIWRFLLLKGKEGLCI